MKAVCLFALCLLAGVVSSEFAWKVGKSYRYEVRGRVMSGITEMNTQYAGLEMNCHVVVTVVGPNSIHLKPVHVTLVEINDEINGGWRDGELHGERQLELTDEVRKYLESPIEFTMEQGIVTALKVEGNLPHWAINMKKAQVSHFVLDTTGVNAIFMGNLDRRNIRPDQKHETGFFYETMEKTVHGECRTYYTVNQNLPFSPPFTFQRQAQPTHFDNREESHEIFQNKFFEKIEADSKEEHQDELPWHKAFHQFCEENDKVFEIIKSVNFTDCMQKPVLAYFSPSATEYVHNSENAAGSFGQRFLVSRYLACGTDRKHFTILNVRQEEQMKVGTDLLKKMIVGAIQNVTLIEITNAKTTVQLQNPKVVKNIVYKFTLDQGHKDHALTATHEMTDSSEELPQMDAAYINNYKSSEEVYTKMPEIEERDVFPKPTLTDAPLNDLLASPLKISGMKHRIEQLMTEIIEDITKPTGKESMAEKETLSKISTIAKMLRYFSLQDVEEIYHQFADKRQTEEEKVSRKTIIDAISIAGTNPNIKLLINLIQKRVIKGELAASVIMTWPLHIRTPTVELLKEILNFVKTTPLDVENAQIKTTGLLALSTLLHQACVNSKVRNSRYPVAMYGHFCDAKIVETEFLPHFVEQLEKHLTSDNTEDTHWKNLYMTTIGNIGHPHVIPVVQRLMDKIVNPFIKVRVIYMLKNLIVPRVSVTLPELKVHHVEQTDVVTEKIVREKVVPIIMSAAMDRGEHPEVRMAAISLLLHSPCVDVTLWQQIAYLTWFEVSEEVHSFIFNSLKNLAEMSKFTTEVQYKMVKNAQFVLALCKPINAGYTKSHSMFRADYIHEHLSGFWSQLTYWGSKDSVIPNNIYYKNTFQYGTGAFAEMPLEFSFHGHTIQKLLNILVEEVYKPNHADREAHEDLAQIREILGIKERKQTDKIEGNFYLRIQNEMERMFSFDQNTLVKLVKQFKGEMLTKLRTGYPIHFQKTVHLREHLMEVPTIFGFPATYNMRMVVHVGLRGVVKVVSEDRDMQIQTEIHPVYAWKNHEKLSFKVPFVGKKYQTGFQRHVVSEFPFRGLIRWAPRGQIEVAITPAHLQQEQLQDLNIVTFHQVPYTVIITDSCWPTTHKEGGVLKIVHALETPYKHEINFGRNTVGLNFKVESETEYRIQNEGKASWMNYINRFHSWDTLINLNWMGEPSLRLSKRKLSLGMSQSETKTFVWIFGREYLPNTMGKDTSTSEETSHEQHSSEEHVEKNSRLYVVAFIGKKTPIRSVYRSTGVQKMDKGTTSTVQYLVQLMMSRGHMKVQYASGKAATEAALTIEAKSTVMQAIREAIVESTLMNIQHDICVNFVHKYERPNWANVRELIVLRKRLLSQDLVMKVQSELKFGHSCSQLPHSIKMQGSLTRDQEMTEWARNKSPEAKKCIEDEKKGFTVSPVCIWVSEQQAAALNKINLEFHYSESIPTVLLNNLYQAEDFMKTTLFTYVFHDRFPTEVHTGEKKIVVDFRMTPDKEYFKLHIVKPTARLNIENVKTTEWIKKILPLTSTQTIFENVRDRTLRFYSEPSCTLEGKHINTFDNVTYRFASHVTEKCQHVLTQDCSGKYPMAVLVKDINTDRKVVTLLLGKKTKIEIMPRITTTGALVLDSKNNFVVLVNGQEVQNFPEIIHLNETPVWKNYIAKVELMVNGGVQVISPRIRVATDATRVVVFGSNAYRNRTCGLCGNFDGEKISELRSPKNCPLSSGSLLVASYSFPPLHATEQDLCKIDADVKTLVQKEENDCKNTRVHIPIYSTESMELKTNDLTTNKNGCEVTERLTQSVQDLGTCKSVEKIRRCLPGCVPTSILPRNVWFTCSQTLFYPRERIIRKNLMIDEPISCIRAY